MQKTKMRVTYTIIAVATLGLALSSSFTTALAQSPHFIGTPTCTPNGSGETKTLTCTVKIAGLGNVATATVQLIADVTTECTNRGGHQPPGQSGVQGPEQPFQVTNGQIVFTATLPVSADCPGPQTGSVTFTNIAVSISTTEGTTVLPITSGPIDP
jgi:hypothetical protein